MQTQRQVQMILDLNNNNSTERSKPEIARRDSVEVKAFVAHAERVMQWGGIEYNLNRLYKTVLDLAEQAEDSGIKEDYTFCLSIQRIDLGKSYNGSGAGLNGLLNVFCEANVYLSEQLAIMTGGQYKVEEQRGGDFDVADELGNGYLRDAMHVFAELCEKLGDAINDRNDYDNWQNVSVSILKDGGAWTSEMAPLAYPISMSDIFGKVVDIINQ